MFLRASTVSTWTLCGSLAAIAPKLGRSFINVFRLPGWPALPKAFTPRMTSSISTFSRARMMNSWIGCGKKQKSFGLLCLKPTSCHWMCDTYFHEFSRTRWVLHTVFSHQCTVAQHDHLAKNWVFLDLIVHKQALQKMGKKLLYTMLKGNFLSWNLKDKYWGWLASNSLITSTSAVTICTDAIRAWAASAIVSSVAMNFSLRNLTATWVPMAGTALSIQSLEVEKSSPLIFLLLLFLWLKCTCNLLYLYIFPRAPQLSHTGPHATPGWAQ